MASSVFFFHRIIDWFGVRKDLKDHLIPTPFPAEQVAQNFLCTEGLQYKTLVDPHFTGPFG